MTIRVLILIFIFLADKLFAGSICPEIGAIRWDAWHGKKSDVGMYEEKILTDQIWHYRLPFCTEISANSIAINCDTSDAMSKEIEYASFGKIDYWAFLTYSPNSSMSDQLKLYLKDKENKKIKFSIIIQLGRYNPENFKQNNSYYLELIKETNYLKLDSRPLVFFFMGQMEEKFEKVWGNPENFKRVIIDLTEKVMMAGLDKPYYILMEFSPEKAAKWADFFGFNAISTYATNCGEKGTYKDLSECASKWWERAKKTGKTVIPVVMAGWDPRPRAYIPAPWASQSYTKKAEEVFYTNPEPEEIAEHLRSAIIWAKQNNSPAIIIYAWNEFSEGGWIMPTIMEGDARLKSVKKVILEECERWEN